MKPTLRTLAICTSILSLVALGGCNAKSSTQSTTSGEQSSAGGEQHAATLAEAVANLNELATAIKEAMTANQDDQAHDPLHKIGHVLEEIPPLADKESIPEDDKAAIKTAVEQLFDCFGRVDEKMHGQEGANYEDVAEQIDQAMATLKKYAGEVEAE